MIISRLKILPTKLVSSITRSNTPSIHRYLQDKILFYKWATKHLAVLSHLPSASSYSGQRSECRRGWSSGQMLRLICVCVMQCLNRCVGSLLHTVTYLTSNKSHMFTVCTNYTNVCAKNLSLLTQDKLVCQAFSAILSFSETHSSTCSGWILFSHNVWL